MALPVLLIHCGNASQTMMACCGNHDSWFKHVLTLPTIVVDAYNGTKLPDVATVGAMIVTGSPKSIMEIEPWMDEVVAYVRKGADRGVGVLGVCFGHQLIAHAFGARVVRNPRGWELGTQPVTLTDDGLRDRLFEGVSTPFLAHMSHQDVVEASVPGMRLLASSELAKVQAFAIGDYVRGVQFHPEANETIATIFIRQRDALLRNDGYDTDALASTIQDTPAATRVLHNFERHFVRSD